MTNPEIVRAAEWIENQIREHAYLDVGIMFTVHDSRITRIEKTIVEKSKSQPTGKRGQNDSTSRR